MELLQSAQAVPAAILVVIILALAVITIVIAYQYARFLGIEGIREQTYQLILKAEHAYKGSETGRQKLKWVVSQARMLLPPWLQAIISEKTLTAIVDRWFAGVKDLLDDGKINGSQDEDDLK